MTAPLVIKANPGQPRPNPVLLKEDPATPEPTSRWTG